MKIIEVLESLDSSWSREVILKRIKNGEKTEKIVNEFLQKNKNDIEDLNSFFRQKDKELLNHLEKLSTCEAKLINKINNIITAKTEFSIKENKKQNISLANKFSSNNLGIFMMKWSNKFVFITLLAISAVALSKQAWT